MNNKKILLSITGVSLVLLFFLGAYAYKDYEKKRLGFLAEENFSVYVRGYSPIYGKEEAKIFITEFLDPECESCRAFYPHVKKVLAYYGDKVKLVVRYAAFHKNSKHAIAALEASRKQDKYWESLGTMFDNQPVWADHHNPKPEMIYGLLEKIGVDIQKLKEDMKDPAIVDIIEQDAKDMKFLNVKGTPTFFVNGKPLDGFGLDYLIKAIESELQSLNIK